MLSIEIIMIIANLCLSTTSLDKDVQKSIKCNQFLIQCMKKEVKSQRYVYVNQALTHCIVEQEISK